MSQFANALIPGQNGYPNQVYPAWQAITPGLSQTVSIGSSSTQSTAFQSNTTLVRVCVNTDTWIKFGSNPTADKVTSIFLPSGTVEYFGASGLQKVAGIQDSAAGILCITEGI